MRPGTLTTESVPPPTTDIEEAPSLLSFRYDRDRRWSLVHEVEISPGTIKVRTAKSVTPVVPQLADPEPMRANALPIAYEPVRSVSLDGHLETDPLPNVDLETGEILEDDAAPGRQITEWSIRSRIRMMYRLATIDWTEMPGVPVMVTLTYPGEFPRDGQVVKQHLWSLLKRWERQWGARPLGCWKLEFQRRGAPHFHLYVGRPAVSDRVFREWLSRAWFEVVGSGDPRHLAAGTGVDRQFCSNARSAKAIAWYFTKHNAKPLKAAQNQVPEGFENVGRFWGVLGMRPVVEAFELTTGEFVELRRLLVRFRRSALGRKVKAYGRLQGCWAMMDQPAVFLSRSLALIRWGDAQPPGALDPGRLAFLR